MFAVQYDRFGGPEVLHLGTTDAPQPRADQIRIRVRAAGISPVDVGLRSGHTPMSAQLPLPHIPGVDAAGIVDEIGDDVDGVTVGDHVFGIVELARLGGASAQFAVLQLWAHKPTAMPWAQAGAAGTSIETATRALDPAGPAARHDAPRRRRRRRYQQHRRPTRRRPWRPRHRHRPRRNHDLLRQLGATPVPYGPGLTDRLDALSITRIDRALDVAGAGSLTELIRLTGDPTAVVTLADFTAPHVRRPPVHGATGRRARRPARSRAAAELFTEGRFRVPIEAALPLEKAADAHQTAEHGSRRSSSS